MEPGFVIAKIREATQAGELEQAQSWLITGRAMWPGNLELDWMAVDLLVSNCSLGAAAAQIEDVSQRHQASADTGATGSAVSSTGVDVGQVLCRMVLRISEVAGGAQHLRDVSGTAVFDRAAKIAQAAHDTVLECRIHMLACQHFEELAGRCSQQLMEVFTGERLTPEQRHTLAKDGVCVSTALPIFVNAPEFADTDFGTVFKWIVAFLKDAIDKRDWNAGHRLVLAAWLKLGFDSADLALKFDSAAPWDICKVSDRLGRLLERFNDHADKRQRLVSVLAALYFVQIGHSYGMLALPGILPLGAQPAAATQDPASTDGNGLHDPLVILPWFRSELTVVPTAATAAAVAAPALASTTSRKRKRAVQVDGVIKMIEAHDDPEPVPQASASDIVDGGGQARLAKTTVVLLAQVWEHVYSDVSGWSSYFGNWGISQIWLELIRADVLVVKGRYSEFLEVPPIAKPKDGMHDPSIQNSPPKDGGTDCHDSGAALTTPISTASPSPSRIRSISLLHHRASLQRASVTIALWYAKEPKLKKFASSESDSARLILLKLLQALPLEQVLYQPAPPALAGTATAGSGGFSLGLVSGALDQVVSRALHMLFICYEADMNVNMDHARIARLLVLCQHEWPHYDATFQRLVNHISESPVFNFGQFFRYISQIDMVEEFMHLVNHNPVRLNLTELTVGSNPAQQRSTRGVKTKGKDQLVSLIEKHVSDIVDDKVAIARALVKFVADEIKRLA